MWNLSLIGRAYAAAGQVTEGVKVAFGELAAAQNAIAQSDWQSSGEHFTAAGDLLVSARTGFQEALQSSTAVMQYADLTGTLRSGDQLLAAGESVVAAGAELSAGMAAVGEAEVFPGKEGDKETLVSALERALDSFGRAHAALVDAERALDNVSTLGLPSEVKEHVQVLKEKIPVVRQTLGTWLDQSHLLLAIVGADRERQYLVIFQNNHEIRPTGGFIGSLGLVNIDRGAVENIDVQTVYDGDGQLKEFIAPPAPLLTINDRWFLRDANWFVEYPTSAKKIASFFEKEGGPTVDGVIALTPEVIKGLLRITGPITMPEYNVVVDADSFVPLTQDLVTYSYDREVNRPKQFLVDLTPILLNRVFGEEGRQHLGEVFSMLSTLAAEKHILIYFSEGEEQERVEQQGWAGVLPEASNFLSVVNANIGGHKSDQFVAQEVDYRLTVLESGDVEAAVAIRRTHNGPTEKLDLPYPPHDNPAFKDNIIYQRVMVPANAELIEATGFTPADEVPRSPLTEFGGAVVPDAEVAEWQRLQHHDPGGTTIGSEGGYRYFANWMVTKPGATSIGLYRYRIPAAATLPRGLNAAEQTSVYVSKQPGDTRTSLRVELRFPKTVQVVHTVPNEGITRSDENTIVYRGDLTRDALVGAIVTAK